MLDSEEFHLIRSQVAVHDMMGVMKTRLNEKNQILIPEEVREALDIDSGQWFLVSTYKNGVFLLPMRGVVDTNGDIEFNQIMESTKQ